MGKSYDIVLDWQVTLYCNFACPCCCALAKRIDQNYVREMINIPGLKKFLTGLNKTIKINFTGGEPLLVANIIDAFAVITENNYMSLITNLTSPKVRDFSDRINPDKVDYIIASAHILQLEKHNLLNTFFSNFNLLKDKGFCIVAQEVAYPDMAKKVEKYKKLFMEHGIELQFQPYRGFGDDNLHKKKYPEAYTEEDCKIFNIDKISCASPEVYNRKHKLCNAGYNIMIAHADGSIYPCWHLSTKSLGNIYTDFKLFKTMVRCPIDYCDCPLPLFYPELFEKAKLETSSKDVPEEFN